MSAATPLPTPDELADSLDEALDAEFTGLPRDSEGRPYLPDDDAADWALRKLARHRAHIAEVHRMARERIDAIRAWETRQVQTVQHDATFFEDLLERYHRHVMDSQAGEWKDKERKTIALPHGTLTARAGRPKVEVADEDTLTAWLRKHRADLVEEVVTYKVSKAQLRKALKETDDGRLVDAPDPTCPDCFGSGLTDDGECPSGCASRTGEVVPGVTVTTPDPSYDATT